MKSFGSSFFLLQLYSCFPSVFFDSAAAVGAEVMASLPEDAAAELAVSGALVAFSFLAGTVDCQVKFVIRGETVFRIMDLSHKIRIQCSGRRLMKRLHG
jgi:hypothetical protein